MVFTIGKGKEKERKRERERETWEREKLREEGSETGWQRER